MAQYNLGTVIGFELTRTLTKPRFWIATLAVPIIAGIIFALIFVSNSSIANSSDSQKNAKFSISYLDASGLIDSATADQFGAQISDGEAASIAKVKNGELDAFFSYPARPDVEQIRVYAKDQGIFNNGKYDAVAKSMLTAAANAKINSAELSALAANKSSTVLVAYTAEGKVSGGFTEVVPPLVFILIFFGLTILLTNQMLNATLEEKENRVTEMILTTIKPTTLVTGKILALCVVGVVQALVFTTPAIIAYLAFREQLNMPSFDLNALVFDPGRMVVGALLLVGGFLLYMTTMVAIGAVMPTAKEAASATGPALALVFVPLYATSLIISNPQSLIVQVFTYIPYSAPTTAMLRNALGTLTPLEGGIAIAVVYVSAFLMLAVAVRLFKYGSISYGSKLSIRKTLIPKGTASRSVDK